MAIERECNSGKYEVNAAVGVIQIILKMIDTRESISLTRLSESLLQTKNKTFRLLTTLGQFGLLEKDKQNKYRIGVGLIDIAYRIIAKSACSERVSSHMKGLSNRINETVYFAKYVDKEFVFIDFVDCEQPIKTTSFVGMSIKIPEFDDNVIHDYKLSKISDVTVNVGGLHPDVTSVSILYGGTGGIDLGVLVVMAPSYRMPLERIESEIVPALINLKQHHVQLPEFANTQESPVGHEFEENKESMSCSLMSGENKANTSPDCMLISEFSKRLGVTPRAIRLYEAMKLVDPPMKSDGGTRYYSKKNLENLKFVLELKELGFSLLEIKHFINVRDNRDLSPLSSDILNTLNVSVKERIDSLNSLEGDILNFIEKQLLICSSLNENHVSEGGKCQSFKAYSKKGINMWQSKAHPRAMCIQSG